MRNVACLGTVTLAIAWLAGCASKPVPTTPVKEISSVDFWKDQAQRHDVLTRFSGKLNLSYTGKIESVSGRGTVLSQGPAAIRLELRDPLGRLHYALMLHGSDLTVHWPRRKQVIQEEHAGRQYLDRVLGVAWPATDFVGLLAGALPKEWKKVPVRSWEWDSQQGAYRGEMVQGEQRILVWVNSANAALQSVQWRGKGMQIHLAYEHFEECCGSSNTPLFDMAQDVLMQMPSQGTFVEANWKSFKVLQQTVPSTAFRYSPLPGEVVEKLSIPTAK